MCDGWGSINTDMVDDRNPASSYKQIYMYIHIYIYACISMYYTTRIPMLLVYSVYTSSRRISIINSIIEVHLKYMIPRFF